MEEQSRTDFRLSAMTQDALIKSSTDAPTSSLLPPTQHIVPPMLPSLDAYLDAYRSLMSQDIQAMSALGGCGLGIRPPGLTMPVVQTAAAAAAAASLVSSPYYGLSPYSVDLARYGLLSPVYVPPFIAPLFYGGAGGTPGLLPAAAEPPHSSPSVPRPSVDRDAPACPPQSFTKSLYEACAAAATRKNDTALIAASRPKPADSGCKPVRHDTHLTDRAKPAPLVSPRTAATSDLLTSQRKAWNSAGKVDQGDVAGQPSTAVDFSARRSSDTGLKSSVAGSAVSSDSWKLSLVSATSLDTAKNVVADNPAHSYGQALSNAVALQCASDQKKFDKVDGGGTPLKAVRNGEIQGVKAGVDSTRLASLASTDQLKQKANNESKTIRQSDGMCRVTSSGLSSSNGSRTTTTTTDGGSLGTRRPARPAGKKRPSEPGVALTARPDVASDPEGKSRSGGGGSVEEFRCRLCNYSGRSQHCLSKHYRAHDLAYKICRYCRRAFERPSDLLRHEERHRRRDVLGSGSTGGLDTSSDTVLTCSVSDIVRQPAVGRIDSYTDGVVASSCLVSARLGPGDNEVILCFDEPAADAVADQSTAPPPSKLRDVYSIMAGIFVNQQFFSFSQSTPVVAASDQCTPRSTGDDRSASLVPDFGQQAFLQMLDLKMVSASSGSSSAVPPVFGSAPGLVSPRAAVTASGGARERRRKGIPNQAVNQDAAADTSVPVMTFTALDDGSADVLDTAKRRLAVADVDDISPAFTSCVAAKAMKLGPEGDSNMLVGHPRDSGLETTADGSSRDKLPCRRHCRKYFTIACKVCGKRLLQGCELERHWQRHSVQDADGCYSCAACSFTSNVRLIMHMHAHVHLTRHRVRASTSLQAISRLRCRLCSRPRRPPVWKRAEDGALVRSLWCSECSRRLAVSRLVRLSRRDECCVKSVDSRRLEQRKGAVSDTADHSRGCL